jgi:signal transduction histidine kinase/ActR/RegA family two-component response regulator
MNGFDLCGAYTEVQAVTQHAHPYEVFERLALHTDWPFVPVVDDRQQPIGVVRERRLKGFAYGRFGRELIRRHALLEFVEPTLVVPSDIPLDELLCATASNPNPDGLLVSENGAYRAVVLNSALLRLHAERHTETRVRLANAEKMEAIGTLAGGIAHDLNNMLTPVIGYAQLIRELLRSGEAVRPDMLDEILVCGSRAQQTVRQILAFSRHQEAERRPTHFSDAVKEVIRLIRPSVPATIDIEMRIDTTQDLVLACPAELHQMLANLCTNAYHAMRGNGGRLILALCDHSGPMLGWSLHAGPLPPQALRVSVTDTGAGIDPAVLPRVFEPFFTTKAKGEGTGMGLAIVHGIASRYKGCVSVESKPGEGTTFHLYLPRLVSSVQAAPGAVPASAASSPAANAAACGLGEPSALQPRRIRALVVDDESAIVRLAKAVLPRHGIEVHSETDSRQAWDTLRAAPERFDVLITDHLMPGMTGMELVQQVRQLRPDLPIILCTGYAEAVSPEQARALGVSERLLKPVDFGQIATLIRQLVATDRVQA